MPGLSDYVVMVRDRARAFLAGPPLLRAATGEIATEEELGGATMHATVSGLAEYLAEDDADGIRIAREVVARLGWQRFEAPPTAAPEPRYPAEELLGLMPRDGRKPVDMREVIARLVDDSDFLEFKAAYGAGTVCAHASVHGQPLGIVTNNGPLDPAGATKATHFIQACCQSGLPLVYLQNTTGYIVGTRVRARRHDQARLEDDPGRGQRDRAAGHDPVRRVLRRRQLRHVRPRLRAALPVLAGRTRARR